MTKSKFRQTDLTKAIAAARKAGFKPDEVILTPEGEIRLLVHRLGIEAGVPDDVALEIGKWARG